jgi:hypothetical protein
MFGLEETTLLKTRLCGSLVWGGAQLSFDNHWRCSVEAGLTDYDWGVEEWIALSPKGQSKGADRTRSANSSFLR